MDLGNFSVSLAVKDLRASRSFYEKLGFEVFHDQSANNWMILKNRSCVLGLFQGMFEHNILTFNPGWDADGKAVDTFDDVRAIQQRLKSAGLQLSDEAEEGGTGPDSLTLVDPDGNAVLIDQHVPAPGAG
ncbi:MAG: VOC family protein [Pseudomonadota bacterium]